MNVEVVAIGTELLLGQIVDTNSSWIGEHLAAAGLNSYYQTKVGDNHERILDVLKLALDRSDAVICCGGLGPTQDDLTRQVLADLLGVELEFDEAIAERIETMFRSRGRDMPANNLSQAMVPAGCSTLAEQPGTAPGLACPVSVAGVEKIIYAVPGVPYEMKEMMSGSIVSDLVQRSGTSAVIRSRVLRTWGISESALAELLADRIDELDDLGNPTLAFLASGVEGIKVRITAKAADEASATEILDGEQARLWPIIGHLVFAFDEDNMESVVVAALEERQLTLALSESVTFGYVAARLGAVAGAERVVLGADVDVRSGFVGDAEEGMALEERAVGKAEAVRNRFGADVGLGIWGTSDEAGPVAIAIASVDGAVATTVQLPGDHERKRQFGAITALDLLRRVLTDPAGAR